MRLFCLLVVSHSRAVLTRGIVAVFCGFGQFGFSLRRLFGGILSLRQTSYSAGLHKIEIG
jgi:hypothetical protein